MRTWQKRLARTDSRIISKRNICSLVFRYICYNTGLGKVLVSFLHLVNLININPYTHTHISKIRLNLKEGFFYFTRVGGFIGGNELV